MSATGGGAQPATGAAGAGRPGSAAQLLARLRALDVRVWAEGDTLRYSGPRGALDGGLREELRRRKGEVLALLREAGTGLSVDWDRGGDAPPAGTAAQTTDPARLRALLPAAQAFRATLHELGLPALLAAYGRSGVRGSMLADARPSMPDDIGTAVDLLCLSRPVPLDAARQVVPGRLLEHLAATGLATVDGATAQLPAARLVEHWGQLLLVGLPGSSVNGYYGPDSVGLGRLLLGASGRCLDLFASVGSQAAVMARGAQEVLAVELDGSVAAALEVNLLLADLLDRVEVRWGDARTVDLGGPYDTVAVNGPLLPNFGLRLPWRADAGPNGWGLLEVVLRRVALAPDGRLFATLTLPGDASGPRLRALRAFGEEQGWSLTAVPTGVADLDRGSYLGGELARMAAAENGQTVAEALDRLAEAWGATGVDRLWFCLLCAVPAGRSGARVVSADLRGAGWWL